MIHKFLLIVTVASLLLENSDAICVDGVIEAGVSEDDAKFILDSHNQMRNIISCDEKIRSRFACGHIDNLPIGVNLKKLKYSLDLAKKAQEIANNCQSQITQITVSPFDYVGQNTFLEFSTALVNGADWNTTMKEWFDDHIYYGFDSIRLRVGAGVFTQLVWAETEYVGCGYTQYLDKSSKFAYNKLYICAYGPGGNIFGQTPYQRDNNGTEGCWPLL